MAAQALIIVTARDDAARLAETIATLNGTFEGARIVVADDASHDATPDVALQAGAELVRAPRRLGRGGAATLACERVRAVAREPDAGVVVLCEGSLGTLAAGLRGLVDAVQKGSADLAVWAWPASRGHGRYGRAEALARWTIRRACGAQPTAPLSRQRALTPAALAELLPFAGGYTMEVAMTIEATLKGLRVMEIGVEGTELVPPLARADRARRLLDVARACVKTSLREAFSD